MSKVLISDKISPDAIKVFKDRGVEVDLKPGLSPDELKKIIGDYDGLAVRSATKATRDIIAAAVNLKVIGRAGIGVDNIDLEAATERGIVVMNTPFGNSITTAEHTIAMLLSLARHIPAASASTKAGKWEKTKFMGKEVNGKLLGIIGCGNIGAIVAGRAQGLGMKVQAYDPYLTPDRAYDLGISKIDLAELLQTSNFVSLHTPLTKETRNIIDKDALLLMREDAFVINCARGGLVDEEALKEALEEGVIAGAALDVFAEEPATKNPLFSHPAVIATPHLGASTTEAQVKVAVQVAEQMSDFLLKGAVSNALNMPSISAEEAPKLKPYMALASQVGSFAGQIMTSGIKKVRVEYEGHVAELNTRPLTAIVLEGLLKPLLDSVNMVNAPLIAKDRNIDISELIHDRGGDYHTMIRLIIETEEGARVIAGTLFANQMPRIVSVQDVEIEAELTENMLYITNDDKPGFIGALGTILGENGVNIGTFNLGRNTDRSVAVALISVDDPITEEVVEKVQNIPNVRVVKPLKF
ncbi:MAG: phosphoglycerate dehydrogenase [Sphingomonadales bacterium]